MHRFQNFRLSRTVHLLAAVLVLFAVSASSCTTDAGVAARLEEGDAAGIELDGDEVRAEVEAEEEAEVDAISDENSECDEETCDGDDLSECDALDCDLAEPLDECDGGVCDLDEPIDECDGGSCDEVVDESVVEEDLCGGQTCVAPADFDWANATCVSTVHVPSATIDSLSHLLVVIVTFGLFANAIVEWEVPDTPGTTTATLDADGNGELEVGLNSYGPYTLASMTVNGEQVPVDGFPELVVDAAEGPIYGNC